MQKEHMIKLVLIVILAILIYKFGVVAFLGHNPKNTGWASGHLKSESDKYDVVVVGEEPEGITAAISASRMGAKTLLISEGKDLGGVVSRSLFVDLEGNMSENGGLLNQGIFGELYNKVGQQFSIEKYKTIMTNLVKENKRKLGCLYEAVIESPKLDGNTLVGINLKVKGEKKLIFGKRFIDATIDGKILNMCGVPRFTGSEDLNMKDSFLPLELNFLIKAKSREDLKRAVASFNKTDFLLINNYETSSVKVRFSNMKFVDQGDNTAVVKGLQVIGVDVSKRELVDKAYNEAQFEAKEVINYLKIGDKNLKDIEYVRSADSFYEREKFHYAGIHTLSVNEILNNTNFSDKIAFASYPIDAGKFIDYNSSIVGKPTRYSIPLGCLIPLKINNLLMVGSKISYSSLAASSAGTLGTNITAGESAGVVAVYTISKDISAAELIEEKNKSQMQEYQALLKKQGLNLNDFKVEDNNASNFSFSSLNKLRNLGLITAGMGNDYGFDVDATQEDFAILILNGVYRSATGKYNLAIDSRIRKFFIKEKLTKNKAGEILGALFGVGFAPKDAYNKAISRGYISDDMQMRLNDIDVLKMEDVYVLTEYNLKLFTGKELDN